VKAVFLRIKTSSFDNIVNISVIYSTKQ